MKKKVLVITSSFPRYKTDWWAQFIANIYKNIDKQKYSITILAPHAPSAKLEEFLDGIHIIRFPYFYPFSLQKLTSGSGILHSSKENFFAKMQIIFFVSMQFLTTLKMLIKNKYDLVHIHWVIPQGLELLAAKYLFKIPVIATVHGSDLFGLKKLNLFKKLVLENADLCTVNSSATQNEVLKIAPKTKTVFIPMGVNTKVFSSDKKSKKVKLNYDNANLILAVGRLIGCKGFIYLIKAMPAILKKFPNTKLLIVGSGPERQNLENLVQKLALPSNAVNFLGSVNHEELSRIYASSDIFVAPSITDPVTGETEGQGIVVLEAMASGIPVVGSICGGIPDLISHNEDGLLIKQKDSKSLAMAIIKVMKNKDLRDKFIKKGKLKIEKNYSWEKIGEKFTNIYTKILE